MADTIESIRKEIKRLGCPVTAEPVDGQPELCTISGTAILASGTYDAHRAHSALQQLQTPDIGDDGCQMIEVALRQIGFATH